MQLRQPKNVVEVTRVFLQSSDGGAQSYESRQQGFKDWALYLALLLIVLAFFAVVQQQSNGATERS